MKYLGIARAEKGQVTMPDAFHINNKEKSYEVVEVGGDILLLPSPLNQSRLEQIEKLTQISISEHRKTLEGLAQ